MNKQSKLWTVLLCLAWVLNATPAAADDAATQAARKAMDCGVPEDTVARILAVMLDGRLSREDGARILDPLVRACDEGLPVSLLAAKADEGLSKAVAAERLRHALERRLDDLRFAHGLVAPPDPNQGPATDVLMGLVEGLEAGLPRQALAELVSGHPHAPPGMLATAARVWAYLNRAQIPTADGRMVVDQGLARRTLTPQWLQLPRLAGLALQKGIAAAEIREAALAALRDGKPPSEVAARLGLTTRRLDGPPAAGR